MDMGAPFPADRHAAAQELLKRILAARRCSEHGGSYVWSIPDRLLLDLIHCEDGVHEAEQNRGPLPPNGEHATGPLTKEDWLQFEMAASGCTSGIANWPWLKQAIQRVLGYRQAIETLHAAASLPTGIPALPGGEMLVLYGDDLVVNHVPPPPGGLQIGDAATAPSSRIPACPNCGSPSTPTDPKHNSKREWTCTKESCGYMFSVPRQPDAFYQPLYTNDRPIADQVANIRGQYACFDHKCRHLNVRRVPLAEDATCDRCGKSLVANDSIRVCATCGQNDHTSGKSANQLCIHCGAKLPEHPVNVRSQAPGTGHSPDTSP